MESRRGGSYFLKITLQLIVTVYAMLKHHSTHNIVHQITPRGVYHYTHVLIHTSLSLINCLTKILVFDIREQQLQADMIHCYFSELSFLIYFFLVQSCLSRSHKVKGVIFLTAMQITLFIVRNNYHINYSFYFQRLRIGDHHFFLSVCLSVFLSLLSLCV